MSPNKTLDETKDEMVASLERSSGFARASASRFILEFEAKVRAALRRTRMIDTLTMCLTPLYAYAVTRVGGGGRWWWLALPVLGMSVQSGNICYRKYFEWRLGEFVREKINADVYVHKLDFLTNRFVGRIDAAESHEDLDRLQWEMIHEFEFVEKNRPGNMMMGGQASGDDL